MSYFIAVLFCVVILTGCDMAQKGAMLYAYSDIEKGKYESALQNLSSAESYMKPTPELEAEILYLRAICYSKMGRQDEAEGVFRYIIDKFPDSSYAYQAKAKLGIKVPLPEEQETCVENQEPAMEGQEPPTESQELPLEEEEQEPVFEHRLI